MDRDGRLVDVRLRNTRDRAAAEVFFRPAWTVTGVIPVRITTDGHEAYPRAMRHVFGEGVAHRTNRHVNHHLEQDLRGITQQYRPTGGLKTFATAARFCLVVDEIRAFLRPPSHCNQALTLAHRRHVRRERFAQLMGLIAAG